jgi:hypothetical protein
MSKDYENLMDSLTNTPYLDTPLEYFKILDDDVEEGSLRQQLAGGGVVTRQNFATKAIAKAGPEKIYNVEQSMRQAIENFNKNPKWITQKELYSSIQDELKNIGIKDYKAFNYKLTSLKKEIPDFPELDSRQIKVDKFINNLFENAENIDGKKYLKTPFAKMAKEIDITQDDFTRLLKNSNQFNYKEVKPLLDKFRSSYSLQVNYKNKELPVSEVFDMANNKIELPNPRTDQQKIFHFAIRHQNATTPENRLIQFFDINTNQPVDPEKVINYDSKVYFKYRDNPNKQFKKEKFTFEGTGKDINEIDLETQARKHPLFKEFFERVDERENMKTREVIHPKTKKPTMFRLVAGELYEKGAGYKSSYKTFPYEIDHSDLQKNPFNKLRIMPKRVNQAAGLIKRNLMPDEYLKKIGYDYYANLSIDDLINKELKLADEVINQGRVLKTPYSIANERYAQNQQAKVFKNKLNLPDEEAKDVQRILSEFSDTGIKFNTFTGLPEGKLRSIYKGLKNASNTVKAAKQYGVAGATFFIPLTITDALLNLPIVAIDTIRGVPAAEMAGTVGLQDFVKDITGVAIPGTTEEQFYEKYKEAKPIYELEKSLEDWKDTYEQYAPFEISKDGKRSGVFLPAKYKTYPELEKKGIERTLKKEKAYDVQKQKVENMPKKELEVSAKSFAQAKTDREDLLKQNREARVELYNRVKNLFSAQAEESEPIGVYGNQIETGQITGNIPQYYETGGRVGYQEAGLVEKLGRGAQALDPRNVPYYAAKGLKGLGSGVEMAVKFPAAAGAAIGESLQKKPTMETLQKFGEAMAPTATNYLSKKFGLEDLIQEKEKELLEKRPGAVTVGNIIELGAELVPPATGYLKLIEDSSSKLYKVIRDGQAGKKVDPKDVEEVLELLSDKGVSRRDFLSIVGGTSIYALAKHIGIVDAVKISQKIKPVRMLSKSTTKMPEWFPSMIEKVLDDTGNSIFKQIDEDAVLITNKEMPGIEITKYDNGRLEVLGENNYGAKYYIEYDPAKYLDDGNYFPGDFSATDTRFYSFGPDDYTKENEIVDQVDDIFGGTDKMREYATGQKKKKLTSGEKEAIEAELRAESFTDEID